MYNGSEQHTPITRFLGLHNWMVYLFAYIAGEECYAPENCWTKII